MYKLGHDTKKMFYFYPRIFCLSPISVVVEEFRETKHCCCITLTRHQGVAPIKTQCKFQHIISLNKVENFIFTIILGKKNKISIHNGRKIYE